MKDFLVGWAASNLIYIFYQKISIHKVLKYLIRPNSLAYTTATAYQNELIFSIISPRKIHFLKCSVYNFRFIYVFQVGKEAIIYEYTDWLQPTDPLKNRDALDRMVGDYAFTCPVVDFAHRFAEIGNNVFFYYFNERASNNPWPTWTGVLHGDEIAFIFGDPLNKSRNYDKQEVRLSKRMMSYWANFAKTG